MAVYILSRLTIHDRVEYDKYENQFDEIFTNFNGKLLSVDEDPLVLAGEWEATRSVVIEFPSKKDALTWMQSDEYQRISKHRNAGSTLSSILVKSSETDEVK
ncbi:MAG: hypothetical protein ACI9UT_001131 [Flavobacteriales bacterium]|jgi:uncharacterized protein (DUF1330 family)